jgi:hypothetical protein
MTNAKATTYGLVDASIMAAPVELPCPPMLNAKLSLVSYNGTTIFNK